MKTRSPKSIPKPLLPRVRRRNNYDRVTALAKHNGENQETLGYSFDTKKFGNSFCLKRAGKDSHFVQKDFHVTCFLPMYSLGSPGGLQVLFEALNSSSPFPRTRGVGPAGSAVCLCLSLSHSSGLLQVDTRLGADRTVSGAAEAGSTGTQEMPPEG